ncbi:hypothetical protein DFH94DRAFT_706027 [Russula ochroleuca]|jgi:hypothetical protein|uniref:Uncharacterized protein n=1 Tax=Russula ochroleuca TaxID=152965 RepID=A0A9P5N680_9AGAM|nr:hypothetical protein DFH94DRAFT_706027 [Russula ochroleuca]
MFARPCRWRSQLWLTRCTILAKNVLARRVPLHSADTTVTDCFSGLNSENFPGKDAIYKRLRNIFWSDTVGKSRKKKRENETFKFYSAFSSRFFRQLSYVYYKRPFPFRRSTQRAARAQKLDAHHERLQIFRAK